MNGARWLVLTAALLVSAVACVPAEALVQCDTEAEVNHHHALDPTLSDDARMIGADGSRAWRAQRRRLSGDDVPGAEMWAPLPEWLGPVAPVTTGEPR